MTANRNMRLIIYVPFTKITINLYLNLVVVKFLKLPSHEYSIDSSRWELVPSACKAYVITATPRNPDNMRYIGYLYHCIECFKNVPTNKIILSRVAREGGMVDYFSR